LEQRQQRYREFVARGIPERQLWFLRTADQRNQLTGSDAFIHEVERRIGERILHRASGRPPRTEMKINIHREDSSFSLRK